MAATIPYIGSRISLISKAEIRYEGILYDVNRNEATVTLSKVRSYGTENRPAQKQVQPRNEVYEYIIFRGSDIKDLSVSEMAKQEEIQQDPAILSTQSIPPPMSSSRQPSTQMPPQPGNIPQGDAGGGGQPHPPGMPQIPPPSHGVGTGYTPFPPGLGTYNPFGIPPYFSRPPMMIGNHLQPQQQIQPPAPQLISSTQAPTSTRRATTTVPLLTTTTAAATDQTTSTSSNKTIQSSPLSHASPPSVSNSPAVISASNIETSTPNDTGISDRSTGSGPLTQSLPPPSTFTSSNESKTVTYQSTTQERQTAQKDDDVHAPPTSHHKPRPQNYETKQRQQYNTNRGGARGGPLTGFTTRGRGTSQRGGVASHRTRGGSNNGAAARQPLRYDSDFDFDSANALFSKESLEVEIKTKLRIDDNEEENATTTGMTEVEHEQELLEEGELDESDSVESCYDKSLSFFDHISCEANSNSRRSTRSQEMALNTETFGVIPNNSSYRGRSKNTRSRGGGARGYHRGSGPNRSYNHQYRSGGGYSSSRGGDRYHGNSSYKGRGRGRGRGRGDYRDNYHENYAYS